MPFDSTGLTVTPIPDRIVELRALLSAALAEYGIAAPSFDGTIEAALVDWAASLAFDLEDRQRVIVDALDPDHASSANLDRHLAASGLSRRPASRSRYTVKAATSSGTALYPAGAVVEEPTARTRWRVVTDTTVTTSATDLVIEAVDTGPNALPSSGTVTLRQVTPIAGIPATGVTYAAGDGDPYSIGRDVESDPAARARLRASRSSQRGPTLLGIRALLLDVPWVTAVSITRPTPGTLSIRVVPGPVGTDQENELAEAIADAVGAGTLTSGSDSATVTLPGGDTVTVYWTVGTTQAVDWTVSLYLSDAALTVSEVTPWVEAAIEQLHAGLDTGDTLRLLACLVAIAGIDPRVVGAEVLLDGVAADVVPAPTTLLTVGTVTVSIVL